ncbi:MAG: AAA family ATPase [Actinobacteria bacterium]|nr:AAA family ATPase [Actinomycetota bacterium]
MLLSLDAARAVVELVTAADFFKPAHGHIFHAITQLLAKPDPRVDVVLVDEQLRQNGLHDEAGGSQFLMELTTATTSIGSAAKYAAIVRNTAVQRRMIATAAQITDLGYMTDDPTTAITRARQLVADLDATRMIHADEPIELIDWSTLHDRGDEYIDGVLMPARWSAWCASAKVGKSTLAVCLTTSVSKGISPLDGTRRDPLTVLYIDAEMGRHDLHERLVDLGHDPAKLTRWHASDLPPKLDTAEGGNAIVAATRQLSAAIVVIDGINGVVSGAEKDDTTWRAFYDCTVRPLKRDGVAVLTLDNLGKDHTLGPRGSSVKLDKADAIVRLTRTDNGIRLQATHRRSTAFDAELTLTAYGLDGTEAVAFRRTSSAWPDGTSDAVALLDQLGLPADAGRNRARQILKDAGRPMSDNLLKAALRYRKSHVETIPLPLEEGPQDETF